MRSVALIALVVLVGCDGCDGGSVTQLRPEQRAAPTLDFGDVVLGFESIADLTVENPGGAALRLDGVRFDSDALTLARALDAEVAPGSAVEIPVRLTAFTLGPFRASLEVDTERSREPGALRVVVTANVEPHTQRNHRSLGLSRRPRPIGRRRISHPRTDKTKRSAPHASPSPQ